MAKPGRALGREGHAWLGQRHGVCGGEGVARAEARRVQWNGSRSEGRGLEDERSELFERDGSRSYAGQATSGQESRVRRLWIEND